MQASIHNQSEKILSKEWFLNSFKEMKLPSSEDERWRRSDPETFNPERLDSEKDHKLFDVESIESYFKANVSNADDILQKSYVLACTREQIFNVGLKLPPNEVTFEFGASCENLIHRSIYQDSNREEGFSIFASQGISYFHAAESKRNLAIEVADHMKLDKPIVLFFPNQNSSEVQSLFIKVGIFSSVEIFEITETANLGGQYLTQVTLAESSKLNYSLLLKGSESNSDRSLHHLEAKIHKDATFKFHGVWEGVRGLRSMLDSVLLGSGATSDVRGIVVGKARQHFDIEPRQLHKASKTFSNMMFKIALKDKARAVFQGDISIDKSAQNCEAYQMNKNLLLSKDARVDSLPKLNILPNQVKCKHGAATGSIDPNTVHYLMARGFSKEEATKLLITSFFSEINSDLEDGVVKDSLEIHLRDKASAFVD